MGLAAGTSPRVRQVAERAGSVVDKPQGCACGADRAELQAAALGQLLCSETAERMGNTAREQEERLELLLRLVRPWQHRRARHGPEEGPSRQTTATPRVSPAMGQGTPHGPRADRKTVEWKKGGLLGQGAFGTVHVGVNTATGEWMAVKNIKFNRSDPQIGKKIAMLQNEIALMKQLQHPNIVRYFYSERCGDSINIFMEYVAGGSMQEMLRQFGPLPMDLVVFYTREIILGLVYLHERNVIHRDIKSANILIGVNGDCRLADFGCSSAISDTCARRSSLQGTPQWMAPEVILRQEYGIAVDIWSLGCTVMEMLTAEPPFAHLKLSQLGFLKWITGGDEGDDEENDEDGERAEFPAGLEQSLPAVCDTEPVQGCKDMILCCLRRDPKERWEAPMLLVHFWVRQSEAPAEFTEPEEGKELEWNRARAQKLAAANALASSNRRTFRLRAWLRLFGSRSSARPLTRSPLFSPLVGSAQLLESSELTKPRAFSQVQRTGGAERRASCSTLGTQATGGNADDIVASLQLSWEHNPGGSVPSSVPPESNPTGALSKRATASNQPAARRTSAESKAQSMFCSMSFRRATTLLTQGFEQGIDSDSDDGADSPRSAQTISWVMPAADVKAAEECQKGRAQGGAARGPLRALADFPLGMRVAHERYGDGEVTGITSDHGGRLTVVFARGGAPRTYSAAALQRGRLQPATKKPARRQPRKVHSFKCPPGIANSPTQPQFLLPAACNEAKRRKSVLPTLALTTSTTSHSSLSSSVSAGRKGMQEFLQRRATQCMQSVDAACNPVAVANVVDEVFLAAPGASLPSSSDARDRSGEETPTGQAMVLTSLPISPPRKEAL